MDVRWHEWSGGAVLESLGEGCISHNIENIKMAMEVRVQFLPWWNF